MSIEQPGITLNYSEPFSPTFEREYGGKSSNGNSWLEEIEQEIEQESQQLESMIEKLLNFAESEIAPHVSAMSRGRFSGSQPSVVVMACVASW